MQPSLVSLLVATELVAPLHALTVTESGQNREYKQDCFKRIPAYSFVQLDNPGAGMNPDEIVPYQTVLKDGYMMVGCVKDAMYEHGDRFGNNKDQYKMLNIANSSIVHYTDFVPKEDRKSMTHGVCFQFCRSVPDMGFFGISNGRDCYCTPFFKPMASDSSDCSSVCVGNTVQMCGGETKNSIFSMHSCDATEEELGQAVKTGNGVEHQMAEVCGGIEGVCKAITDTAQGMQETFGQVGDPAASNQMQQGKKHAGEWLHEAEKCLETAASVKSLLKDADKFAGKDFSKYDDRKAAEDYLSKLKSVSDEGADILSGHVDKWVSAQPSLGSAERQANQFLPHVLDQYYSIMYFADKDYADDEKFPVTCDGDLIGDPALGLDAGRCAAACDENVGKCVGFAAYQDGEGSGAALCYLFSKFKTVQYYTGCNSEPSPPSKDPPSKGPPSKGPPSKVASFLNKKSEHSAEITGWTTLHKHNVHVNFTAQDKAACAQKRQSAACTAARATIAPSAEETTACFLKPDQAWKFGDLPGYYSCLGACCEDYDPNLMMDGLTCVDLMGYEPCENPLMVSNPPPNTKIETVCPKSCEKCSAADPVTTAAPTTAPPTTAPPVVPTLGPVIHTSVAPTQTLFKSKIKAMCRAKFSRFGSASVNPDPSGRSKFALKELTKADRCFN